MIRSALGVSNWCHLTAGQAVKLTYNIDTRTSPSSVAFLLSAVVVWVAGGSGMASIRHAVGWRQLSMLARNLLYAVVSSATPTLLHMQTNALLST